MLPILLERIMVRNTEKEVAERIKQKHNGTLEYISGYKNKDSLVKVRCLVCGETFERTYHHLTTHPNACPVCKAHERNKAKAKETERKERNRLELQRKAEERNRKIAERVQACPVCGKETSRRKYCCRACANKANNKTKDHRRRKLLQELTIDKDITVEGLFRRDKGICYLCKGRCDFEDYTVRDGYIITGDWYPSIDHVIPLAKGGAHSWGNVRLAHRLCNSLKGAENIGL